MIKNRKVLNQFSEIILEDVTTATVMFQLLSNKRRKDHMTQAERYLNLASAHFIKRSNEYFKK
jgi:hypothetical protein